MGDPRALALGDANIRNTIVSFLPPRAQVAASGVNRAFHESVRAVGEYDVDVDIRPNMMVDRHRVGEEMDGYLEALADIAWSHFHQFLDQIYSQTDSQDAEQAKRGKKYASNAKSAHNGSRAWAVVPVGGYPRYSTNFLMSGESVGDDNQLNTGYAMYHSSDHYRRFSHFHAELRIGHARTTQDVPQHSKQINPVNVNMAYCIFCAVNLAALGERLVHPFHTGKLEWYRFSEWILLFRSQRRRIWGPLVENAYGHMNAESRKAFLKILVTRTTGAFSATTIQWKQSPSLPQGTLTSTRQTALERLPSQVFWNGSFDQFQQLRGHCPGCGATTIMAFESGWYDHDAQCSTCGLRFFVSDMPRFSEFGDEMEE